MTAQPQVLKIRRPDDWHIHLRDGDMLKTVVPYTSEIYGRAIVMPNLVPPVTTVDAAIAYRQRILDAVPAGHDFTPLMTCYLTDSLDPNEVERGFNEGVFTAAKLYPANATTNSSHGVTSIDAIMPVLERMQKLGMPLLVHGEVTHAEIDIFDRDGAFAPAPAGAEGGLRAYHHQRRGRVRARRQRSYRRHHYATAPDV